MAGPRARRLIALGSVLFAALVAPRWICGAGSGAMYRGAREAQRPFALRVATSVCDGVRVGTGSEHFDGEWSLVAYQFALLGMGQVALAHPSEAASLRPAMRRCAARLMDPATRAFGTRRWREDGVASPRSANGHAYLGYLALGLGMLRRVDPETPLAATHDALIEGFVARMEGAPGGLIETYPGEAYPADVAAVIGAIGLHGGLLGRDRRALLSRWSRVFRARFVDRRSGYLVQRASLDGAILDGPRGSGTAVAAYFLSFADRGLARSLASAVRRGVRTTLGFGGVREHPDGVGGGGDIDSGPVLFGVSVSATAFGFASMRLLADERGFAALWRTATLFGAPRARGGRWGFRSAGPMGDALLLAMMTAAPR